MIQSAFPEPVTAPSSAPVGQNVRVRKVLIAVAAAVFAVVVGAVGADFGATIYAEYRLARSVRAAAQLSWENKMRCGIGICGACEHEGRVLCLDGPVLAG